MFISDPDKRINRAYERYLKEMEKINDMDYDPRTSQRKLHSFMESIVNVLVGYGVGLVSQILIFPLYGIQVGLGTNISIALWFTIISIIRSYILRRAFNHWHRVINQ